MKQILTLLLLISLASCSKESMNKELEIEGARPVVIELLNFGSNQNGYCKGASVVVNNQTAFDTDDMCLAITATQPNLHLEDDVFTVYLYEIADGFHFALDTFNVDLSGLSDTTSVYSENRKLFVKFH
jgi:hypothetical protein